MGKKKKFIDKKTAHHFFVMHRSQQDPLYYKSESEGGSKYILHPANAHTAEALEQIGALGSAKGEDGASSHPLSSQMSHIQQGAKESKGKALVDEMGFPIDGYDYSKHLAPVTGLGTIISSSGKVVQPGETAKPKQKGGKAVTFKDEEEDKKKKHFSIPAEVLASSKEEEYDRKAQLESITLREDTMDDDIAFFLDDEIDVDPEDDPDMLMDDDFMTQLIQAEKANPDGDKGFDLDDHFAKLIAQAEAEDLEEEEFEDDDMLQNVAESRPVRDIDEHFDALFEAQYGDEEIGELEEAEFDETVAGELEPESERVVEVLSEYLNKVELDKGAENKVGDGNLKTSNGLTESNLKQLKSLDEVTDKDLTEEALLKHYGYENKPKPKFDCETIVSTYSTLDNHPTLISGASALSAKQKIKEERRRLRQLRKADERSQMDSQEYFEDDKEDYYETKIDTSIGRDKKEGKDEKRARKRLLKEQRRLRRMEKKENALMFKEEAKQQVSHSLKLKESATAPPGVSTFRL